MLVSIQDIGNVEVPDDATPDEVTAWANNHFQSKSIPQNLKDLEPSPALQSFASSPLSGSPMVTPSPGMGNVMSPITGAPSIADILSSRVQKAYSEQSAKEQAKAMNLPVQRPRSWDGSLIEPDPNEPVQPTGPTMANQFLPAQFEQSPEQQNKLDEISRAQAQDNATGVLPSERASRAEAITRRYDALIAMASESRPENVPGLEAARDHELAQAGFYSADLGKLPTLPRVSGQDVQQLTGLKGRAANAVAALQQGAAGAGEGLLAPEGMLMTGPSLAAGLVQGGEREVLKGISSGVGKAFLPQMAVQLPKSIGQAAGAYSAGDYETGDRAVADAMLNGIMLGVAGHEAFSGKGIPEPEPGRVQTPTGETSPISTKKGLNLPESKPIDVNADVVQDLLDQMRGNQLRPAPVAAAHAPEAAPETPMPTEAPVPFSAEDNPELSPETQPAPEPIRSTLTPEEEAEMQRVLGETQEETPQPPSDVPPEQSALAAEAQTLPEATSVVKRVARGSTGLRRFDAETQLGGPDILSWIKDNMPLLSRSAAREAWGKEKFGANRSLWDDSAPLRPHQNVIYSPDGSAPDRVAQAAYDDGIISEPTPSALWEAINSAGQKRQNLFKTQRREAAFMQQEADAHSDWLDATTKGEQRISADQLKAGDHMDVDGERVQVVDVDPEGTVTLKDGRRFGLQKLPEGTQIHVEKFEPSAEGEPEFTPQDTGIGATARRKIESGQQGEAGFIRLPTREEFVESLGDLPEHARNLFRGAVDSGNAISDWFKRRGVRNDIAISKDAADNLASLFSKRGANIVRHELNRAFNEQPTRVDLPNPLRENALTMAVEAQTPERLAEMRQRLGESAGPTERQPILGGQAVSTIWKRKALQAIDFAQKNWDKLQPVVDLYKQITDQQHSYENQNGIETPYRATVNGGYVYHDQDVDSMYGRQAGGTTSDAQGPVAPSPFTKVREHPTYADSIAAGLRPRSLSAVELLQKRLALGQRLVNYSKFVDGMFDTRDPRTGDPIVTDAETRKKSNGQTYSQPPEGYGPLHVGGRELALHNGYAGLLNSLTDPSWFKRSDFGDAFIKAVSGAKHAMLLFDSYHLGRLAFWNAMTRGGLPRYGKGLTLLDNTIPELKKMVANGEIPKEWGDKLAQNRLRLDAMIHAGLNVAQIGDNLHTDWIEKLPVAGPFNKWLFGKYQRGAMAESALIERDRLAASHPEWSDHVLNRQVARDINTRFGNLQSQGIFRSKTFQDLARVIFLAPQWNESLIRSELGAMKQAGQGILHGQIRPSQYGTLAKGVGTALVMQFAANQIINYLTRGKPTWQNQEGADQGAKGWAGAKISAYIPDALGGPGFFWNPATLPTEIAHLLMKSADRHGGNWGEAIKDYLSGRLSGTGRAAATFWEGKDPNTGRQSTGLFDRLLMSAKQAMPTPISGSAAVRFGKQAIETAMGSPQHEELYPGQFERQLFQSAGVKLENAPTPEQRMFNLASDFNQSHNVQEDRGEWRQGPMTPLIQAIRRRNQSDEQAALENILANPKANGQPTTTADVQNYFDKWANAPFTRSRAREADFRQTLNPEQQQAYTQAQADRHAVRAEVYKLTQNTQ